jgi:hypothetical protein
MRTPLSRATGIVAAALVLLVMPLSGCSGGDTSADAEDDTVASSAPADDAPADDAASGEMYGCTPELIEYAAEYGYPDATPADPATFEIPQATFTQTPECYIADEYDGAPRYAAFWTADPEGTLAALGTALTDAGFQQSEDYGPLVWWLNGDDPVGAEVAIAAAPQPIGDTTVLWATW